MKVPLPSQKAMAKDSFSVLLVDDSDDDRLFLRRALRKNPGFVVVGEVCDGEEAIAYLAGQGEFGDREKFPYPDVVLLDLKLPRMSGFEVLEWIQAQKPGKLHVVVLSGSFLPEDITRSRALGAAAYFKKEALEEEQQAMIADMEKLLKNQGLAAT
jgi:CheY-like chemotaxis protein